MDSIKENEKKESIAVIRFDKKWYFDQLIDMKEFQIFSAYKKLNLLLRILRKSHLKMKLPFLNIWFSNELLNLKKFKKIIIFDSMIDYRFVKYISRKMPQKRIIFWYWNPVKSSLNPKLLTDDICEKWSYSIKDCEDFKLNYNTTFYFKNLKVPKQELKYDIFFIGKDKGRLNELLYLKNEFEKMNLRTNFHITPTRRYMIKNNTIYKKPISYDMVLAEIGKSKAILDILSNKNDGLSLRPMESIFHRKKLITNSRLICDYDFYRPQNIFILGKDDLNDLPKFLNSPYEEIDKNIIDKYDFKNWMSRF